MQTKTIEPPKAKSQLPALVAQVVAGTEIGLVEGSTPRGRPVAPAPPATWREPGLHPGCMEAAADFDAPLPDDFWLGAAWSFLLDTYPLIKGMALRRIFVATAG